MGQWILVTSCKTGRRLAIPTHSIAFVEENGREDIYNGRRATIHMVNGSELIVYDSFDDIGGKVSN